MTKTSLKSIVTILFVLCVKTVSAQNIGEEINIDRIATMIDSLLSNYNEDGPGVAIGLVKDGQLVYEKYFGLANLNYKIPIGKETTFHVASVSKQFTAFAILLLEDDGNELIFEQGDYRGIYKKE